MSRRESKSIFAQMGFSSRSFQKFIDLVPGLLWVKDKQGRIVKVSPLVSQLTQQPISKIEGAYQHELFPENGKQCLRNDQIALRSGRPLLGTVETFLAADGSSRLTLNNRMSLKDKKGNIIGLLVSGFDITEQKRLEEQRLQRSRRFVRHQAVLLALSKLTHQNFEDALREILQAASECLQVERVGVWELRGDLLSCKLMFSRSTGEYSISPDLKTSDYPHYFKLVEESLIVAVDDARNDIRSAEFKEYVNAFNIGSVMSVPFRVSGKINALIGYEHRGKARSWSREEQEFAFAIADLTSLAWESSRRRRTQRALRRKSIDLKRSNRELERFASTISHDLQQPLSLITTYAPRLKEMLAGQLSPGALEYFQRLDYVSLKLNHLAQELTRFIHVGPQPSSLKPVELQPLIGEILEELKPQLDESGVQIRFSSLPTVAGEYGQLRQLFYYLIQSSLKFHQPGQTSIVEIIEIFTEDSSHLIGVRNKSVEFNSDQFLSDKEESGVINLSICKKIAKQHGGKLWVESEPGCGSRFSLRLPRRANKLRQSTLENKDTYIQDSSAHN